MAKQTREVSAAEVRNAEEATRVEQEIAAHRSREHAGGTVAGRAPHEYVDEDASGSAEADLERRQAEERKNL